MGVLKRYKELLPVTAATPDVNLEEGSTPLIPLPRIGARLGIQLYGKFEGCNPSGSFKDRGMVLAVAKALEEGKRALICASTGNTSASAAAYAASVGVPCFVLLPAGKVAMGKLAQALMYGATVIAVRGNFDRALELARAAAESGKMGLAMVNSVNPYRLIGQRTGAWEVCEALGDQAPAGKAFRASVGKALRAPDWHAIPVGNAGNISAYWAGYQEYLKLSKIEKAPRMMGFQAAGAAPLVTGQPCPNPETVATAIRIGNPVSAHLARAAVQESGGEFNSVTDEEILSAQRLLASEGGVFAEPASCAPLAGLVKLKGQGKLPEGITVTMVLTGNGLKDPDTAISSLKQSGGAEPIEIGDTEEELMRVLERRK